MASRFPADWPSKADLGTLGEGLVADWLTSQGWDILERQWQCRWGELDLVALHRHLPQGPRNSPCLAFVEVKTRGRGNWDADGLMAITRAKQHKLWQAARLYLTRHPTRQEVPCRFDVALVACQRRQSASSARAWQPIANTGYGLILQDYIDYAFEVG